MIEVFWKKHYQVGITGSYHGDMCHAFRAMLDDPEIKGYPDVWRKMKTAIISHKRLEAHALFPQTQRKCFTEYFPEIN